MTTPETVEAYTARIVREWRDGPGFPHLGDHQDAIPAVRSLVHRVLEDAVNGRVVLPVQLRIVGGSLSMPPASDDGGD